MRFRAAAPLILMLIASGCGNAAVSDSALCERLAPLATQHAAALADDGGPRSVSTGRRLIAGFDAGCGKGG